MRSNSAANIRYQKGNKANEQRVPASQSTKGLNQNPYDRKTSHEPRIDNPFSSYGGANETTIKQLADGRPILTAGSQCEIMAQENTWSTVEGGSTDKRHGVYDSLSNSDMVRMQL